MKKLLKSLAFLAVATMAGTAWADSWGYYGTDRSWIAIDTGAGPVAYNLDGTASPSFQGADLGEIPAGGSLIIVSYDTKTWKNNADISDCEYFFKLDDGQDFSIGGGWMADLSWSDQKWGNGDVYLDVAEGLSPGPHTLSIHGRITGNPDPSGNIWEPSETTYYTANFTIAEPTKTVTFDGNGDNVEGVPEPLECVVGGVYKEGGIPSPTRTNYRFRGWYTDPRNGYGERIRGHYIVEDAEPMTLWAHWDQRRQTVTFDANDGGAGAELLKEESRFDQGGTYSGSVFTMKGATWANHKFLGWYDQPEGGTQVQWGDTVTSEDTRKLYAHWRQYRQVVTFHANGEGASVLRDEARFDCGGTYTGSPFTMNGATWDNHYFMGWYDEATGERVWWGDEVTGDFERDLYAHWRAAAAPLAITGFSFASKTANGKRDASSILSEDFAEFTSGANTDISSSLDDYTGVSGWTGSKVYSDSGRAKLGSSSAVGWIVTPAIDLPAGATISCTVAKYGSDTGTVSVDLSTDDGSTWSTLGDTISPTAEGGTYERTVTSAANGAKIRFKSSAKRFYLDDVVITAGSSSEPTVTLSLDPDVTKIAVNDLVEITAEAEGFDGDVTWTWTGEGLDDGNTFVFGASVADEYTVTATATAGSQTASESVTFTVCEPHAIIVTAGAHGVALADADTAIEGTMVTVDCAADDGYTLDAITVNGTPIDGTSFEMPDAVANVNVAFKEKPAGFEKITSLADLKAGSYVITGEGSDGKEYAMMASISGTSTKYIDRRTTAVTIEDGAVTDADDSIIWTLAQGDGGWTIYQEGFGYVGYVASGNSSGSEAEASGKSTWDIAESGDNDGLFLLTNVGNDSRYLKYNSGSPRFACYTSGQKNLAFYKAPSAAQTKTVTFDGNGDNVEGVPEPLECVVGGVYKEGGIPSPTRTNYRFRGWYTDPRNGYGERIRGHYIVEDAEPMTLWAHWDQRRQTVTFDANDGGAGAELLKEESRFDQGGTYSGSVFTMKGATWANHKFLGWYDQPEGGTQVQWGDTVTSEDTRKLYAHWRQYRQVVTFHANGEGASVLRDEARFDCGGTYTGSPFTMNGATWDNHYFMGWYDEATGERVWWGDEVTGDFERDLYAHWRNSAATLSITGFSLSPRVAAPAARKADSATMTCTLWIDALAGDVCEISWASAMDGEWMVLKRWISNVDGKSSVTVDVPTDSPTGFFRLAVVGVE